MLLFYLIWSHQGMTSQATATTTSYIYDRLLLRSRDDAWESSIRWRSSWDVVQRSRIRYTCYCSLPHRDTLMQLWGFHTFSLLLQLEWMELKLAHIHTHTHVHTRTHTFSCHTCHPPFLCSQPSVSFRLLLSIIRHYFSLALPLSLLISLAHLHPSCLIGDIYSPLWYPHTPSPCSLSPTPPPPPQLFYGNKIN